MGTDTKTRDLIKNLERCASGSYDGCKGCEYWQRECMVMCSPLLEAALAAARELEIYERMLAEGKLVRADGTLSGAGRKPAGTGGGGNESSGGM